MRISDYIDADLLDRFEFYNYNHAIEIITQAFPKEWSDVVECLRKLDITTDDLREAGGNETKIPKKFDDVLYPCGWREIRISGDLHIKFYPRQADQRGRFSSVPFEEQASMASRFFYCPETLFSLIFSLIVPQASETLLINCSIRSALSCFICFVTCP